MKTIIDKDECKPLSDHIEGKLVVINTDFFREAYRRMPEIDGGLGLCPRLRGE